MFSGVFEEKPLDSEKTWIVDGVTVPMPVEEQIDQIERRMKCWATLFAHMSAFASINFGGIMQQGTYFERHPGMTFLVIPIMYLGHVGVLRLFAMMRRWRMK